MRRTGGKDRDIYKARKTMDCCKALKLGKARGRFFLLSSEEASPLDTPISGLHLEIKDHKKLPFKTTQVLDHKGQIWVSPG